MRLTYAIAAVSENGVIGNHNSIPWRISEDFRWFKYKTMGGTLVMGRKTFESIGKPLPGRKTIVLTRQPLSLAGVTVSSDLAEVSRLAMEVPPCWICGGSEIYRLLLPTCDLLYLTRVKRTVEGDAYFPDYQSSFTCEQVIHDSAEFRVERWSRIGTSHDQAEDRWPL